MYVVHVYNNLLTEFLCLYWFPHVPMCVFTFTCLHARACVLVWETHHPALQLGDAGAALIKIKRREESVLMLPSLSLSFSLSAHSSYCLLI